jgi:hypothetical protein
VPRGERVVQRRRELGLDADHARLRPSSFHRGRDPRDQAAAADRHEHDIRVRNVLEQLEPDGSLARGRERVVERVHERPPRLLDKLLQAVEGFGRAGRSEIDLAP